MDSIKMDIRIHFPLNVLQDCRSPIIYMEGNQGSPAEEDVIILPTPQHITKLETAMKQANVKLELQQTGLKFVKHEELNEYYIQVVDTNNNVVQEIPSKKELDFFAAFMEFNQLINKRI